MDYVIFTPGATIYRKLMSHTYGIWPHYFRKIFVPQAQAFADCLTKRLLPTFESVEEEAQKLEQEEYERLSRTYPYEDGPDDATLCEWARDEAITYYQVMHDAEQGVVNLFAIGLYHLLEQQLTFFVRRWLLFDDKAVPARIWDEAKTLLLERGVNIETVPAYPKVNELRLLANCIKHGDGKSCEDLRQLRPELFRVPGTHELDVFDELELPPVPVIQPLGGEDVYVSKEEFEIYVAAVKSFWTDLSKLLETSA